MAPTLATYAQDKQQLLPSPYINPSWVRSSSGISRAPERSMSCNDSSRPSVNHELISFPCPSSPPGTSNMSSNPGNTGSPASALSRWVALLEVFLVGCEFVGCWVFFSLAGSGGSWTVGDENGSTTLPSTFPEVDSWASFCFGFVLFLRSPLLPLPPDEWRPDFNPEPFADASLLWSRSLSPFFHFAPPVIGKAASWNTWSNRSSLQTSTSTIVMRIAELPWSNGVLSSFWCFSLSTPEPKTKAGNKLWFW